jgi:hypothetical protein
VKLAPKQVIVHRHPREERKYDVALYDSFQFCEFINQQAPQLANRFVVNIGAHDGKSFDDPCYPLFQRGYAGVAIEGSNLPQLAANLPAPDIHKFIDCCVTPFNIAQVLQRASTPQCPDFFKIDIDGYDGPVLAAALEAGYRPKLIQVEVNPEIPPPIEFSVLYHPKYRNQDSAGNYTGFYGMSLAYAARLARAFGYHIIHLDNVTYGTHDAVLLRDDLAPLLGSDAAMHPAAVRERYLAHPPAQYFHFGEYGFDPMAWRYRTDYTNVAIDVWNACLMSSVRKHDGHALPFAFDVAV